MRKIAVFGTFLCAALLAMGCFACTPSKPSSSVVDVSWVSEEKVYFLQEDPSGLRELWAEASNRKSKVATSSEVPGGCGPLDFIFKVRPDVLGVALECDGFEQLLSYSSGGFAALWRVPPAADVAIVKDGRGYIGTGVNGCWGIEAFGVGGEAFDEEWRKNSCSHGSAKSPALLADGGLAYLRTEREAPETPVRDESRPWAVLVHRANGGTDVQIGPTFYGLPDLATSPSGFQAVVTFSKGGSGEVVKLDLASGSTHSIYKSGGFVTSPSVSPDGRYVAFIDGGRLVKQEISV